MVSAAINVKSTDVNIVSLFKKILKNVHCKIMAAYYELNGCNDGLVELIYMCIFFDVIQFTRTGRQTSLHDLHFVYQMKFCFYY